MHQKVAIATAFCNAAALVFTAVLGIRTMSCSALEPAFHRINREEPHLQIPLPMF